MILGLIFLFIAAMLGTILVGLVGTGSTLILLPALTFILPTMFHSTAMVKMAVATTLATTFVVAAVTSVHNIKQQLVDYTIFKKMLAVYLFTTITGTSVIHFLPAKTVALIVALILVWIVFYAILSQEILRRERATPSTLQLIMVFLVAGWVNSLSGIGTGNVALPFLNRVLDQKVAKATSVLAAAVACGCGGLAYVINGWHVASLPKYAWGYVYAPALLVMAVAVLAARPIAKFLNKRMALHWLRYVLYGLALAAAIELLRVSGII